MNEYMRQKIEIDVNVGIKVFDLEEELDPTIAKRKEAAKKAGRAKNDFSETEEIILYDVRRYVYERIARSEN